MSLDVPILVGCLLGLVPMMALALHVAREHLRMRREVERLREDLYDLRSVLAPPRGNAHGVLFDAMSPEQRRALFEDFSRRLGAHMRPMPNPFLIKHDEPHGAPAPIVVESLGPPCDPPEGKGPYR